jgi:hypothetical protein
MKLLGSLFRESSLDPGNSKELHISPVTTVVAFSNTSLWALLTILPISASQSILKCDIYTSRQDDCLKIADEEALNRHCASLVDALEQRYTELELSSTNDLEPVELPLLKEHLKRERLAGTQLLPGRREDGRSESFCRAEKGM